ncbi:MAG TPA: hypothetical protein VMD58_10570 [Acidobacteriaceae bacterium]|nr:hypothetical protein [Acidobacteriaceae bacterium]
MAKDDKRAIATATVPDEMLIVELEVLPEIRSVFFGGEQHIHCLWL